MTLAGYSISELHFMSSVGLYLGDLVDWGVLVALGEAVRSLETWSLGL